MYIVQSGKVEEHGTWWRTIGEPHATEQGAMDSAKHLNMWRIIDTSTGRIVAQGEDK